MSCILPSAAKWVRRHVLQMDSLCIDSGSYPFYLPNWNHFSYLSSQNRRVRHVKAAFVLGRGDTWKGQGCCLILSCFLLFCRTDKVYFGKVENIKIFFPSWSSFYNELMYLWRKSKMRPRKRSRRSKGESKVCVCVYNFSKNKKIIEEGLFQASNDRVCSLFCAIVFALFMKSLSMTQELPLCSLPPSTSIYFRVDWQHSTRSKGLTPKPSKSQKF